MLKRMHLNLPFSRTNTITENITKGTFKKWIRNVKEQVEGDDFTSLEGISWHTVWK